jgi:hypothetical protein
MSKALKTVAPTPTPSIGHWPAQKKIRLLADSFDEIVSVQEDIVAAGKKLAQSPSDPALLERAKEEANYYDRRFRTQIASGELAKLKKECSPKGWWDDDDEVQQPEIAMMVAKLVGSFPTSNIPDPKVFVRVLIEDVMACNPSFVVFDSACKKLRTELKFMPSVAEVVAEIERQDRMWDKRFFALSGIEYRYGDLVKLIAESEVAVAAAEERRERERAAAEERAWQRAAAEEERERQRAAAEERRERERKYREAKAAPLVVGDRVRHKTFGAGVTTMEAEIDFIVPAWRVRFDHPPTGDRLVAAHCLEKLVEGDEGFPPRIEEDFG